MLTEIDDEAIQRLRRSVKRWRWLRFVIVGIGLLLIGVPLGNREIQSEFIAQLLGMALTGYVIGSWHGDPVKVLLLRLVTTSRSVNSTAAVTMHEAEVRRLESE